MYVYHSIILLSLVLALYFFCKSQKLKEENIRLRAEVEVKERATEEKLSLITGAQEKLSSVFQALSADALERSSTSFLKLAKETFENAQIRAKGDLDKRQQSIEGVLNPVKEFLDKLDHNIRVMERERKGEHESLKQQLKMMIDAERGLREETSALVKSLRVPIVRGRWGEIQLRRVVELAGMVHHCDFYEQKRDEEGMRPDLIVHMPGNKRVIIDAKTPCEAFLEAMQSHDLDVKEKKLKIHARHVRQHVMALSKKAYWQSFQPTPEFVVLFIPSDNFFNAALEFDPTLIEVGIEQGVIIATPTTLIGLLRAIAYGWKQENLSRNAQEVSKLGHTLYKRIVDMCKHVTGMGKKLAMSVEAYNQLVGSIESRVLVSARKFRELGAASRSIELEHLEGIDLTSRGFQSPEVIGRPSPPSGGQK